MTNSGSVLHPKYHMDDDETIEHEQRSNSGEYNYRCMGYEVVVLYKMKYYAALREQNHAI